MTIGEMAKYMRQLLPVNIQEAYPIGDMFCDVAPDEDIRRGVVGFRDFMLVFCDTLSEDDDLKDVPRKGKVKYSDGVTLTVEFPVINNIRSILINIGQYGILSEQGDSLLMTSWDKLSLKRSLNKHSSTKISTPQMLKCLRFLEKCGIFFDGINLEVKKLDLKSFDTLAITYLDNPVMLTGWKALSVAQSEFATRKNDDILLRCDYSMLKGDGNVTTYDINAFVNSLSEPLQNLVKSLHQHYLESGMICQVELGFFDIHFIYYIKKSMLWRFSVSYQNGYRIVLKTKKMEKYKDVIDNFSEPLRQMIIKGYGCDRKEGSSHGNCHNGCEGFKIALDQSILSISDELKTWQDCELANFSKRRE